MKGITEPTPSILDDRKIWPATPEPAPDFHQRLAASLVREAALRRRARVVRIMRLYWLTAAAVTLFILYRLPSEEAGMRAFFIVSASLMAPALLLAPRALRSSTLGELFLSTVED